MDSNKQSLSTWLLNAPSRKRTQQIPSISITARRDTTHKAFVNHNMGSCKPPWSGNLKEKLRKHGLRSLCVPCALLNYINYPLKPDSSPIWTTKRRNMHCLLKRKRKTLLLMPSFLLIFYFSQHSFFIASWESLFSEHPHEPMMKNLNQPSTEYTATDTILYSTSPSAYHILLMLLP